MNTVRAPARVGTKNWDWSRTCIFGVLNVTPDSFFDGGRYFESNAAVARAYELADEGADVIDIGGESTRPGAVPVEADEELTRVLPVIETLAKRGFPLPISIDTYKAEVARAAITAGASLVNDISGLKMDDALISEVAGSDVTLILGHMRGRPSTMLEHADYTDVVGETIDELRQSVRDAVGAGVAPERIWVDPGIGFAKRGPHSLALMGQLPKLCDAIGYPVMVGPSRKSFIGEVTGSAADERLMGTCAAVTAAILGGACAVRVHDVAALLPAIRVGDAIRRSHAPLQMGFTDPRWSSPQATSLSPSTIES